MTAQQIVNDLILDNQNLVIEELMKHDDSIWDSLQNFDENTEVLEWWLVTPYVAELEKRKRDIFWDVEYAMLTTGIKYFDTCSEYWLIKVESEYIKAEKEYIAKLTDI